ncbi:MAG: hypothetical protein WCX62_05925, partial [Synergistaceae bacterium]
LILRLTQSGKFSSEDDLFMQLQPFHYCLTIVSRRWFSGSFTIVMSRIHHSSKAANSLADVLFACFNNR